MASSIAEGKSGRMRKQIEILAPAGSYDAMIGAYNGGADAVYIGGLKFGARAFADNPDQDTLLKAIDYAHLHNKKLYLTINTLLKDKEAEEELYEYLLPYYERGLDAVIVQDMGALALIRKNFPGLSIHASTQMTITGTDGVQLLEQLGVSRVVLSRELSLEEIKEISCFTNTEIETFVHGALCYCYSGQCFMSSMIGGRSGNRGRCAQPCRMPYTLEKTGQTGYFLSPKDICTVDLIPELVEAGISSFKIEGRMKSPWYAAYTAFLYRKYTDLYLGLGQEKYRAYQETHKKEREKEFMNLMDLYNRGGFSAGYYKQHNGNNMMAMTRPNHNGVLAGIVEQAKAGQVKIRLVNEIHPKDILEIRTKENKVIYEFTVKEGEKNGGLIKTAVERNCLVKKGYQVYRTKNQMLISEIENNFLKKERNEPIEGSFTAKKGTAAILTIKWEKHEAEIVGDVVAPAQRAPLTKEKLEEILSQTGDTPFYFKTLVLDTDGDIFIPVGKIKQMRREALDQLLYKKLAAFKRRRPEYVKNNSKPPFSSETRQKKGYHIAAGVLTKMQAEVVMENPQIDAVYFHMEGFEQDELSGLIKQTKERRKACYLILPAILRNKNRKRFAIEDFAVDGYVIKNYEELLRMAEKKKEGLVFGELILDYNMYTLNTSSRELFHIIGADRFTAPVELNYGELSRLGIEQDDLIVYGRQPLMVSAQCLKKNTEGCKKNRETLMIKDRYQKVFPAVSFCNFCYNVIYNTDPLSLLSKEKEIRKLSPHTIRLEFTLEDRSETADLLNHFIQVFRCHKKETRKDKQQTTKGHFNRGME